jgi:exoribonuclease-2
VRLDAVPLYLRVPSLPACDPGTRVAIEISRIDLLDLETDARFGGVISGDESTQVHDPAHAAG